MRIQSAVFPTLVGLLIGFSSVLYLHEKLLPTSLEESRDAKLSSTNNDEKQSTNLPGSVGQMRLDDASEQEGQLSNVKQQQADVVDTTDIQSPAVLPAIQPEGGGQEPYIPEDESADIPPLTSNVVDSTLDEQTSDELTDPPQRSSTSLDSTSITQLEIQSPNSPTDEGTVWSAVWRPFFSQATARGFAGYIGDVTGLSLRVTESRIQGQYLVEVAHKTEIERLAADKLIVETTGYRPADAIR